MLKAVVRCSDTWKTKVFVGHRRWIPASRFRIEVVHIVPSEFTRLAGARRDQTWLETDPQIYWPLEDQQL
jgi:hypothetical protein